MIGRAGTYTPAEKAPMMTRDGLPLMSAQASYPYICDEHEPVSPTNSPRPTPIPDPRFNILVNTSIVALTAPFFQYLPDGRGRCQLTKDATARGLGYPFVKKYVESTLAPGRSVIVVPAAVGGQSIDAFSPDRRTAQLWARMMNATLTALQYRPPGVTRPLSNRVAALLWLQGESDASKKSELSYATALRRMVTAFRANVSDAGVPFVAGQLLQHMYSSSNQRSNVHEALSRLALAPGAAGLAKYAIVSSAGLVALYYRKPDRVFMNPGDEELVHFDEDSLEQYGLRFYAAFRSLLATPSPSSPPSSPRPTPGAPPVHACHWSGPTPLTGDNLFSHTDELDGVGPQYHLFLRGVTPAQFALPRAVLFYEVKLAQYDALRAFALGQSLPGPARALRVGLPMRTAATNSCTCSATDSKLVDGEGSTGWVATSDLACGYAFVDRAGPNEALSPNAELSFNGAATPVTVFTPFRFNNTYAVPLMGQDDGESLIPVANASTTPVRGATMAPGLAGVWLPLHQARGFPNVTARAAAEARGTYWVALIRGVAVVPELLPNNTVIAKRLPSQQTLAVRLPPPPGVRFPSTSPSKRATSSRTSLPSATRSRTRKPKL